MQKLVLDNVSLIAVSSVKIDATVRSLKHCLKSVQFRDAFLLTDYEINLYPDILTVPIRRLNTVEEYSDFMIRELCDYANLFASHILVVQWDGTVVHPEKWEPEFLDYDYIGAPWPTGDPFPPVGRIGNGGFSLRSKALLKSVKALSEQLTSTHPEDVVIGDVMRSGLEELGIRFPSIDVASRFASECCRWHDNSFGLHGNECMSTPAWPLRPVKLDIGGGSCPIGGDWLIVDGFTDNAHIKAMMWDIPLHDETVDEIYSSHALEHIAKADVHPTLCEWHRILKPGGRVIIRVPDLDLCCRYWLENQSTGWGMDMIFGNQQHAGEFHKTGFTESILRDYLSTAGFDVVYFERIETHNQITMSAECRKTGTIQ